MHNQPMMPCGRGPSCIERFCRCLLMFIATACLVVICTYISLKLQTSYGSSPYSNEDLAELKSEIEDIKSDMQELHSSRDDTEKKLDVIENLLRDLKRTAHPRREDSGKCPARLDAQLKNIKTEIADDLNIYDEDKTGRADFALESAGGHILETRETESYPDVEKVRFWGVTICTKGNSARAMIQPGSLPGECWAFKGSRGCAIIELLGKVRITGVSIEHITRNMSPSGDIETAPNDFTIRGMESIDDTNPSLIGKFKYDINGTRVRYFKVTSSDRAYRIIEFKVLSNHGHPNFTCVYRLRIHGELKE